MRRRLFILDNSSYLLSLTRKRPSVSTPEVLHQQTHIPFRYSEISNNDLRCPLDLGLQQKHQHQAQIFLYTLLKPLPQESWTLHMLWVYLTNMHKFLNWSTEFVLEMVADFMNKREGCSLNNHTSSWWPIYFISVICLHVPHNVLYFFMRLRRHLICILHKCFMSFITLCDNLRLSPQKVSDSMWFISVSPTSAFNTN